MTLNYHFISILAGVLSTVGLYSVLYKENKLYRLCEHIYIGLAVGYTIVALWATSLHDTWWTPMVGSTAHDGAKAVPGFWAWMLLLPVGLLGYTVFSRKYNWMSRIPIGMLIGFSSGQTVWLWFNQYGPQIYDSMRPILPTTTEFFVPVTQGMTPEQHAVVSHTVYISQAINNFLFVGTILCVLTYFLFSFDMKNRALRGMSLMGRWLLMVGFGAIFGSTVAMRFTLVIDRMYFVCIEFLKQGILHIK